MIRLVTILTLTMALCACQSRWEALERLADIEAKRQHPKEITNVIATIETGEGFSLQGQAKISIVGKAPQQPYSSTAIPDGGKKIADAVQSVTGTAAIVGGAALLHNAAKDNHTTNNYYQSGETK